MAASKLSTENAGQLSGASQSNVAHPTNSSNSSVSAEQLVPDEEENMMASSDDVIMSLEPEAIDFDMFPEGPPADRVPLPHFRRRDRLHLQHAFQGHARGSRTDRNRVAPRPFAGGELLSASFMNPWLYYTPAYFIDPMSPMRFSDVHGDDWRWQAWDMQGALPFYQQRWQSFCNDEQLIPVLNGMATAGTFYEINCQKLYEENQLSPVLNNLERPNGGSMACPHVTACLETLEGEMLEWLTRTYLWENGKVRIYGPATDGYIRKHDHREWTAAEKLEQLISETRSQRAWWCACPDNDILEEWELGWVLAAWKNNYYLWMAPEDSSRQHRHGKLRTKFRTYLFQMAGSYEMVLFFLVAPFNNRHLQIWRECSRLCHSRGECLDRAKNRVRYA